MTELESFEKIEIIDERLKSLQINIYNSNLALIEVRAVEPIDQVQIDTLQTKLNALFSKKEALQAEREKVLNESGQ